MRDFVQTRFRANQIGWSDHLRDVGENRGFRGVVQMRPAQCDIVGLAYQIANPDTEGRTEVWFERLIVPMGRHWGKRVYQRPIFEIAGAGLQEQ
jgi:hypothetical protein